jgi:rhodanese-related sulfurtransferase
MARFVTSPRESFARARGPAVLALILLCVAATPAAVGIYRATLEEPGQRTPEISTDELRRILAEGSATVLDARPRSEYAIGHIPGAKTVPGKAGLERSRYVPDIAEVAALLREDRKAPIVLYCSGPASATSKRLAEELLAAGYTNVRRYQLGIPVWRALGGICAVDFEGFRAVVERDRTSVVIDAREERDFRAGSLPGAKNIPRSLVLEGTGSGEVMHAIDDGRLPMEDRGTRVFVLGEDGPAARFVAEALAREAFTNVSYFEGAFAKAGAAPEH